MKRSTVQLFLSFLLLVLLTPCAFAQASRTWVSGVGDDANPCSRTAPCKTFAGAISKTAAGGEIDALDPGGFGAVTITKAMTIDGGGGQVASVLVSGTNGIIVAAGAGDTIILRNLRINGISSGLNGIRFLSGKQLVVETCEIFGFTQNAIDVALNQATNAAVAVHNTNFTNNAGASVSFAQVGAGTVLGSLSNIAVREAANGVVANSTAVKVDISNSTLAQLTNIGLWAAHGTISAENNMISGNVTGVQADTGATVRLENNGIYNNNKGINLNGGTVATATNNRLSGNTINGGPPNGTIVIQ